MAVEPPGDGIDPGAQLMAGQRADDIVVGAGIEGFHRRFRVARAAQHQHRVAASGPAQAGDMLDGAGMGPHQHRPVGTALGREQVELTFEEVVGHRHWLPIRIGETEQQTAEGVRSRVVKVDMHHAP